MVSVEVAILWVCQSCMLHHANGECGDCHSEEGHDKEPWSLLEQGEGATMWSEEPNPFSWYHCDGCGSELGGERHKFSLWRI